MRRENFKLITNTKKDCQSFKEEKILTYKGRKLTKRADGRWQYAIQQNKKRRFFISKTQNGVIKKVKKYEKQQTTLTGSNSESLINTWYKTNKEPNISAKTKELYQNTLNNYILPFFKDKNIENIELSEIQKFINDISFERRREQVYQQIKSIFKYAYASGKINRNITDALILPKRQNIIKRNSLTIAEQQQLLNNIKGHKLEKFIIFSLVIGTRRNETLSFCLSDIDKQKGTLHIKGTKTKNAERTIKISSAMIKYLESDAVAKDKQYFNFTPDYITKKIKDILKAINPEHCVHSLRHTCATNLFYLNIPDKKRQQILGHKSIVTTNNIYTSLELDITKADVIKLYNNLYYEF